LDRLSPLDSTGINISTEEPTGLIRRATLPPEEARSGRKLAGNPQEDGEGDDVWWRGENAYTVEGLVVKRKQRWKCEEKGGKIQGPQQKTTGQASGDVDPAATSAHRSR
jgi:hypothetical protein